MKKSRGTLSFVIPEIFNRESMFLNNLDPGLKIAGVTRRWASTSFQYRRPRLKDCRGDGTRCHCEFVVSLTWQSQVFYSI